MMMMADVRHDIESLKSRVFRRQQAPEYDLRRHLEWEEEIRNLRRQEEQHQASGSSARQGAAISGGGGSSGGGRERNALLAEEAEEERQGSLIEE